jgi:predicted transcriptional regulator
MGKAMTLRLDDEQAKLLEKVAELDNMPVTQVVRDAIDEHVKKRSEDPEFRKLVRDAIAENKRILDKLAKK